MYISHIYKESKPGDKIWKQMDSYIGSREGDLFVCFSVTLVRLHNGARECSRITVLALDPVRKRPELHRDCIRKCSDTQLMMHRLYMTWRFSLPLPTLGFHAPLSSGLNHDAAFSDTRSQRFMRFSRGPETWTIPATLTAAENILMMPTYFCSFWSLSCLRLDRYTACLKWILVETIARKSYGRPID